MTTTDRRDPRLRLRRGHIAALSVGFAVALVVAWPDRWVDVASWGLFFGLGVVWVGLVGDGIWVRVADWQDMHTTLRAHRLCGCAGCIDDDGQPRKETT